MSGDVAISAMPSSVHLRNLTTEAVPCVQRGRNVRAPAAAFGIPIASAKPPLPAGQFQTWIDQSTSPATLRMYVGSEWVGLYALGTSGSYAVLSPSVPVVLPPSDPSSNNQAASKHYVDNKPVAAGTMVFRGVIDCSGNPLYPAAKQGDVYVATVSGKIGGASGPNAEAGDQLLCKTTAVAGDQAAVGSSWSILQGNTANAVSGAASSVGADFVQFSGTTGKLFKDGGLSLDTDQTMAANSDARVPSQRAVRKSIGGSPISGASADALQHAQGWHWDTVSPAAFRARTNEGLNLLVNPSFDVWQENTSYVLGSSATKVFVADFWKAGSGGLAAKTLSRVPGISDSQYALKCQRTAGSTDTRRIKLAQQFGQAESTFLAGKTLTASFDVLVGADYSMTTGLTVSLFYGSGIDEDLDLHSDGANFPTIPDSDGNVQYSLASQIPAPGTVARLSAHPLTLPAGITEFAFVIVSGLWIGTAGADDSFTVANVKLEIGNIATPFRRPEPVEDLKRCQRRYWKSFVQPTLPAQNIGAGTGEHRAAATKAGAVAQTLGTLRFPTMRTRPALTLLNPAAANAQARDLTAGADCSATAAQNVTESACEIVVAGNASTAVGNTLGVHAVADARL